MSEGMNRRLTIRESINLKIHLFMCSACKTVLKQFYDIRKLLRAFRKHIQSQSSQSPRLSQEAKNKIKNSLAS